MSGELRLVGELRIYKIGKRPLIDVQSQYVGSRVVTGDVEFELVLHHHILRPLSDDDCLFIRLVQ